jgi:excisionase family DNA binding protein
MAPIDSKADTADELKPLAVTVRRACDLTGLGETKIYELLATGRLERLKVGARTLVRDTSLEALLNPATAISGPRRALPKPRRRRSKANAGTGGNAP